MAGPNWRYEHAGDAGKVHEDVFTTWDELNPYRYAMPIASTTAADGPRGWQRSQQPTYCLIRPPCETAPKRRMSTKNARGPLAAEARNALTAEHDCRR